MSAIRFSCSVVSAKRKAPPRLPEQGLASIRGDGDTLKSMCTVRWGIEYQLEIDPLSRVAAS